MTFARRRISLTLELTNNTQTNQPNTFVESATNTVTLSDVRTSVRIQNSGAPANATATVQVWGLTPSLMNQLATLGMVFNLVPKNILTIHAGDDIAGMATVFTGTIFSAATDYERQPDVPLIFACQAGAADATINAPPSSFQGSSDVATIMSGFARQMNLGFENNGVSLSLSNAYFSGSIRQQAARCASDAGISWGVVNGNTLAIWPKGGNRNTPNVPIISADTGMVGYPAFTPQGIIVKTLFSPLIAFGGLVQVESSVLSGIAAVQQQNQTGASPLSTSSTFPSQWAVNKLDLALDSLLPKGQWLSMIYAYNPGYARALMPPA